MKILTEATPLALWHELLEQAEVDSQIILPASLKAYLVMMLMRHLQSQSLAKVLMAERFLQGMQSEGKQRAYQLQLIGDQCLILTGLFPGYAEKRQLTTRYYIEIGQIAYEALSQAGDELFASLSREFIPMKELLQSTRPALYAPLPDAITQLWENDPKSWLKDPKNKK